MEWTKEAILGLQVTACWNYKINTSKSGNLRDKFIEGQAKKEEDKGNHDKAQKIVNIRINKHEHDANQEIKYVLSPSTTSSILHIDFQIAITQISLKNNQPRTNGANNEE